MKIISLTAENVKRLKAVHIEPDGSLVVIAGRNGQGKTSVLDSIWYALGGGPATKATQRPIRDGQDKATVTLDLGDLKVTRTWTAKGTTLRVESADGSQFKSPQGMLDDLIGRLSFDPLAFTQQDAKTQVRTLLDLVDLPFDPAALDARRAAVFEERTGVNREVKRLQAQLDGLPQAPDGTPEEEVSVGDVMRQLQDAQHQHQVQNNERARLQNRAEEVEARERALAQAKAELERQQGIVDALPDLPDLDALSEQAARVDETNRAVRAKAEVTRVATALAEHQADADALTGQLADIDRVKRDGLATAAMPIPGLGFDETGVTYQGVPFAQCSGAEQLRVSVAMAMAMNPSVRVIRITDGSLLDSSNLALIEEMAGEHDFQVWIERVEDNASMGVVIEDGLVVDQTAGAA